MIYVANSDPFSQLILRSYEWGLVARRIAWASLPLLSLYKPARGPLSFIFGSIFIFTGLKKIYSSKWKEIPLIVLQTGFPIAMMAAKAAFRHPFIEAVSTIKGLVTKAIKLPKHLHKDEYGQVAMDALGLISNSLGLAFLFKGRFELKLMAQSVKLLSGLYRTQDEFQNGHRIEATGCLLMTLAKGYQFAGKVIGMRSSKAFQN